jgi:hypothetical protein
VVDRSVRHWTQISPKNLNMDSFDENAFVRIMYFLDEMVSKRSSNLDRVVNPERARSSTLRTVQPTPLSVF